VITCCWAGGASRRESKSSLLANALEPSLPPYTLTRVAGPSTSSERDSMPFWRRAADVFYQDYKTSLQETTQNRFRVIRGTVSSGSSA